MQRVPLCDGLLVFTMMALCVFFIPPGSLEDDPFSELVVDESCFFQTQALQAKLTSFKNATAGNQLPAAALVRETAEAAETMVSTTLSPLGIEDNAVEDFNSLMTLFAMYTGAAFGMGLGFSFLRRWYPMMYMNNLIENIFPGELPGTLFGWLRPTLSLDLEEVAASVGLDKALLLEYTHLCMKILILIGPPMMFVIRPVNYFFGGHAAGMDRLSYFSFGNVQYGSKLYIVHALVVWAVVWVVQHEVMKAQQKFVQLRMNWLFKMAVIRANTVLVEGIPEEYRSEKKLREFFEKIFERGSVEQVHVLRDTTELRPLVCRRAKTKHALQESLATWALKDENPEDRPMHRESFMGTKVDSIAYYEEKLKQLEVKIEEERARLNGLSEVEGGINLHSGFVTFASRKTAEIALQITYSTIKDEWNTDSPPTPQDTRWSDLTQNPNAKFGRRVVGWALAIGLFFIYLPLVIAISDVAEMIRLPGALGTLWESFAPGLGLQFVVAFLPTFLITIFKWLFTLKAEAWAQYKVQSWCFALNIVFVVLAAAIAQDFTSFVRRVVEAPFSIFVEFGLKLPAATHFFMNYLILQWMIHFLDLTRYVNMFKFFAFRGLYGEEEGAKMAEPEDQDYYGMGARTARWSTVMSIALVYGTISPPINLFAFINFAVCRLVYGYLVVYAETKKPDLGGAFWVQKLRHLLVSLILYTIIMTGVFWTRANPKAREEKSGMFSIPVVISALAIPYSVFVTYKFDHQFSWEKLPFTELLVNEDSIKQCDARELVGEYIQPELTDESEEYVQTFKPSRMEMWRRAARAAGTVAVVGRK